MEALAEADLEAAILIDSDNMTRHDANRGLDGLDASSYSWHESLVLTASASPCWVCATVTRLVNYEALPEALERLGFDAVTFSYPRRERIGSSSLVYSEDSELMEHIFAGDLLRLESIKRLEEVFEVPLDPSAALDEVTLRTRRGAARQLCRRPQILLHRLEPGCLAL